MTNKEKTTIDQLSQEYHSDTMFDVDKGLHRLHKELGLTTHSQQDSKPQLKVYSRRSWWSIAAGITLLLAVSFFIATSLDKKETFHADENSLTVPLPDGSSVILKKGAKLSFGDDFGNATRRIELSGEAYFSVEPDSERPFLVTQDDVTLRVVGTTFNLMADPNNNVFEVEVSSGKVVLETDSSTLPVAAMERGRFDKQKQLTKTAAPNLERHAWKTGKLIFAATPLKDAIETIERTYDIILKISKKDLLKCGFPITATFENAQLSDVLLHIEKLAGGHFLSSESGKVHRLVEWCD